MSIETTDCAELRRLLQLTQTGANAHTAGKASMYLGIVAKKLAEGRKPGFSNCSAEEFIGAVKNAVHAGEWEKLANLMGGWW
jgi:hypothetical protein